MSNDAQDAAVAPEVEAADPNAMSARRRGLSTVAIVVVVLGIILLGYHFFIGRWHVKTENAYVGAESAQLTAQVAGTILSVTVSDTQAVKAGDVLVQIDPADARLALMAAEADLAKTQRSVRQLMAGQVVNAAQVNSRLADAQRAQTDIARAGADVARAQDDARRASSAAGAQSARVSQLVAQEAQLAAAAQSADLALTRLRGDRDRRLAAGVGAVSEEARDHAVLAVSEAEQAARAAHSAYDAAKAALDAARLDAVGAQAAASSASHGAQSIQSAALGTQSGVQRALNDVTVARAQLAASGAMTEGFTEENHPDVIRARARVEQARLDLARCQVRAPFDGVVARRTVQIGQRVGPGASLMTIVPVSQLYVDANFKESQLTRVMPGQDVILHADLYGNSVKFHGRVMGIGGGTGAAFGLLPAQNATGNWIKVVQRVPVRISLDPAEVAAHPLRVGLSMHADVSLHPPRQNRTTAATAH